MNVESTHCSCKKNHMKISIFYIKISVPYFKFEFYKKNDIFHKMLFYTYKKKYSQE